MARKRTRIEAAGFRFTLEADDRRVEQIRSNALYRNLIRPTLQALKPHTPAAPRQTNGTRQAFDPSNLDARGAEIWRQVSKLKWYQSIDLGHGVVTPGFVDRRSVVSEYGLPDDLTGKRALDVGTYDGFWAFEMERRGAEVIGIDLDSTDDYDVPRKKRLPAAEFEELFERRGQQKPGAGFGLARKILDSNVERKIVNVYDLSPEKVGMVDVVFVSEVLLHLRDPQTALENIFSVLNSGGIAIIGEPYQPNLEELETPVSEFKGASYMGIWWGHSSRSLRHLMEVAGFDPVDEISRLHLTNEAGGFDKVVLRGNVPAMASLPS